MDRQTTYEALDELRGRANRGQSIDASACPKAWSVVCAALFAMESEHREGTKDNRDDATQEAWLKVMRHVGQMRAENPPQALSWLGSVYRNALRDTIRRDRAGLRRVKEAGGSEVPAPIERVVAAERADQREPEPEDEERLEDALWDAVDRHLEVSAGRRRRAVARRNAQLAYLRVIHGWDLDRLREQLREEPSRDTLSQWIRRGRKQVLEPAVESWLADMSPEEREEIDGIYAARLLAELRDADRADAGKPRPARRGGRR